MATFVYTNAYLALNGTDYSASVRSVTLDVDVDTPEFTSMASAGTREYKQGLKAATLNVEFNSDYANAALDAALWGFYNTGSNINFEVRPTSGSVSTSNPKFTGNVTPGGYTVVGGAVGDAATTSISWPISGAVTRATA